ncbi:hypothetical protein ACPBEH_05155 [Latilactobacillus sp. 5-91]|uniref:hypothetical protein n=1 Tax=Latilactobacillus sp. 5-91 TaxID=3410924 RepID=UPI003C737775
MKKLIRVLWAIQKELHSISECMKIGTKYESKEMPTTVYKNDGIAKVISPVIDESMRSKELVCIKVRHCDRGFIEEIPLEKMEQFIIDNLDDDSEITIQRID